MNVHVNPVNTCCDKCKGSCFNLEMQVVEDALYAGKYLLSNNSIKKNNYLVNGYAKGVLCKDIELNLLNNLEILEKYLLLYKTKEIQRCLCDDELSIIIDNILGIADISCCSSSDRSDIIIDDSGYNEWVVRNPYCQVYETWESAYLGLCTKFNIENVFRNEVPKLIYEINIAQVKNKCDLITAISIQNDNASSEENCEYEVEYKVISQKCDLTFEMYSKIRNCGVKANVISKIVDCGINVSYNSEKNTCDIHLSPTSKIALCDLKFNINSEKINCELASNILGVDLCEKT